MKRYGRIRNKEERTKNSPQQPDHRENNAVSLAASEYQPHRIHYRFPDLRAIFRFRVPNQLIRSEERIYRISQFLQRPERRRIFDGFKKNTLIWTVSVVGISTVLSLGIAQLLNRDFPGRRWVRAALIIPWAVSLIITSVIWKWILDYNYGALNLILLKLNLINENIFWLLRRRLLFLR